MLTLDVIRRANAQGKQLCDLVVAFVGGTGGIGTSTAKELFQNTTRPKAYIIGRDETKASWLIDDLLSINPSGQAIFLQVDVSLIKNIDEACTELKRREPKIHCLFLTTGYMAIEGRRETAEGIDNKMVVNYYGRMRWIHNCMPLLTAASSANEISRVISVLAAGSEVDIRLDDLDLKKDFTLHACLAHCVLLTDFAMEEFAKRYPDTSFSHSYPGTVKSGIANELFSPIKLAVKVMFSVISPWILNLDESGDRHFFQMTSLCYPAANGGLGLPIPEGAEVMKGSNGRKGSGAYLLNWDSESTGDEKILKKYRDLGFGRIAREHTAAILERARQSSRKRAANCDELENRIRRSTYPPGWRGID